MLSHDVYFSLKDNSEKARQDLVDACKKYLTKHPGTVFFAVGTVADELKREVNDRDFDVGLHLLFNSKAAHDEYQEAERHQQFIDENKDNWKQVRVFDTKEAHDAYQDDPTHNRFIDENKANWAKVRVFDSLV